MLHIIVLSGQKYVNQMSTLNFYLTSQNSTIRNRIQRKTLSLQTSKI